MPSRFLFHLLRKRPVLGLKVLGSLLLAAAVVIAIGLMVEETRFSVPLCIAAAAAPAYIYVRAFRRGEEALNVDDELKDKATAQDGV